MSYKRETFVQLFDLFNIIADSITRKNASKDTKKINSREFILIKAYNSIVVQVKYCLAAESNDKQEIEEKLEKVEETLSKCLGILTSKILIPTEKLGLITKERPENITNPELGIEQAIEKINEQKGQIEIINLIEEIDIKMNEVQIVEHLNRCIKDSFDGEPTQLDTFISRIELAQTIIQEQHPNIFIAYVKSRLTNKALETARDATTVNEIKTLLRSEIKPENSRVLENRLKSLRIGNRNKAEFAKEVETTSEMLRLALIAEKIPSEVAKRIIIEKTIETCNNNTKSDKIKSILSAKTFKTSAEIVSELFIQIDTCKIEHQINALRISNNYRGNNYRGNNNNRGNRNNNRFMRQNNNRYNGNRRYNNNQNRYNNNYNRNYNRNFNNNRGYNSNRGRNNNYRGNRNRGNYQNYNDNRDVRFLGTDQNQSQQEMQPQHSANRTN